MNFSCFLDFLTLFNTNFDKINTHKSSPPTEKGIKVGGKNPNPTTLYIRSCSKYRKLDLKISKSRQKMQRCCQKGQFLSCSQVSITTESKPKCYEVRKNESQLSLLLQWMRPIRAEQFHPEHVTRTHSADHGLSSEDVLFWSQINTYICTWSHTLLNWNSLKQNFHFCRWCFLSPKSYKCNFPENMFLGKQNDTLQISLCRKIWQLLGGMFASQWKQHVASLASYETNIKWTYTQQACYALQPHSASPTKISFSGYLQYLSLKEQNRKPEKNKIKHFMY